MEEVRKKLFELQDLKYKKFHGGLCPNVNNMIGVRIPELRKIAKQIAKEEPEKYIECANKEYYEEVMIEGFVIGYAKLELEKRFYYLDRFVSKIDNWATCDCTCSTFKFAEKNKEEVWNYLQKYVKSENEFELRFLVIMLMDYYLTEKYIDEVLKIYKNIKSEFYYVKMGVAWAISVAYIKFPEKTMKLLKSNTLDGWTHNKSLQKIIESNRVDKETKNEIRKMKK